MAGRRFGRLLGIAFSHAAPNGRAHWLFACDCGGRVIADGGNVRRGGTSSCGCLHREISAARLTVHGRRAGKRHDATYRAWQEIHTLCGNPAAPRYPRFGGAGATVCQAWDDFERFLADMGERPARTVLARKDAAAGFGPSNCHWQPVRTRAARAAGAHRDRADAPPRRPARAYPAEMPSSSATAS